MLIKKPTQEQLIKNINNIKAYKAVLGIMSCLYIILSFFIKNVYIYFITTWLLLLFALFVYKECHNTLMLEIRDRRGY